MGQLLPLHKRDLPLEGAVQFKFMKGSKEISTSHCYGNVPNLQFSYKRRDLRWDVWRGLNQDAEEEIEGGGTEKRWWCLEGGKRGAFPILVLNSMFEKHVVWICFEAKEGQDHTVFTHRHTNCCTKLKSVIWKRVILLANVYLIIISLMNMLKWVVFILFYFFCFQTRSLSADPFNEFVRWNPFWKVETH